MNILKNKEASQSEVNLLKDICCQLLSLDYEFAEWDKLYQAAKESLKNTTHTDGCNTASEYFEKSGINFLPDDHEIFIINEIPHAVYKLTWQHLQAQWEELWSPPMDDALLFYIPKHKMLLLTHWDIAYVSVK